MIKKISAFITKIESAIRANQRKYPILYTVFGGTAVILLWKGVWDTADSIPYLRGPLLILISFAMLLLIGLFVSFFVSERQIISDIKTEEKLTKETEKEVKSEEVTLAEMQKELRHIEKDIHDLNGHKESE